MGDYSNLSKKEMHLPGKADTISTSLQESEELQ